MFHRRSETIKGQNARAHRLGFRGKTRFGASEYLQNLHVALQYVLKCGGMFKDPKSTQKSIWLPPSEGCLGGYTAVLGSPGGELPHFGEGTTWNHGTTCAP